jgi:hypothetical protein
MRRVLMLIAACATIAISGFAYANSAGAVEANVSAVTECHDGTVWVVGTYTNLEQQVVSIQFTAAGAGDMPQLAFPGSPVESVSVTGLTSVSAGNASWAVSGQGVEPDTKTAAYEALDCNEPEPETTTGPLHNNTAKEGSDCPDEANDYWHFVLTSNNGSSSLVSITLNLDGDLVTFTGEDIIPNGTQHDNVFIEVPNGYELSDLAKQGSQAEWTGPAKKFALGHVCKA